MMFPSGRLPFVTSKLFSTTSCHARWRSASTQKQNRSYTCPLWVRCCISCRRDRRSEGRARSRGRWVGRVPSRSIARCLRHQLENRAERICAGAGGAVQISARIKNDARQRIVAVVHHAAEVVQDLLRPPSIADQFEHHADTSSAAILGAVQIAALVERQAGKRIRPLALVLVKARSISLHCVCAMCGSPGALSGIHGLRNGVRHSGVEIVIARIECFHLERSALVDRDRDTGRSI